MDRLCAPLCFFLGERLDHNNLPLLFGTLFVWIDASRLIVDLVFARRSDGGTTSWPPSWRTLPSGRTSASSSSGYRTSSGSPESWRLSGPVCQTLSSCTRSVTDKHLPFLFSSFYVHFFSSPAIPRLLRGLLTFPITFDCVGSQSRRIDAKSVCSSADTISSPEQIQLWYRSIRILCLVASTSDTVTKAIAFSSLTPQASVRLPIITGVLQRYEGEFEPLLSER